MNYYLNTYSFSDQLLDAVVPTDLAMVVVIPCFNEPNLINSLQSLYRCQKTKGKVEVITVINAPEDAGEEVLKQNAKTRKEAEEWATTHPKEGISFHFIQEDQLPTKDAGVGLARKIGMDEAVRRLEQVGNSKGIIVCFDADATCDANYLVAIEDHFNQHPNTPGCSIHFEHPLSGNDYPEYIYKGIEEYELHLRYYKNGLKFCGLPYAYHTIGSSMAVRSNVYQKQNGMNKRKAGEDFYFLQKIIPLGNFTEINTTKVIPSPRTSDRVPFGTGKAMQNYVDNQLQEHTSYHPQSFLDLQQFCETVPQLYSSDEWNVPDSVSGYLKEINIQGNLEKIRKNSTSQEHFVQLFYHWFNAFRVLKYMHYARDHFYPDVSVFEAANELLGWLGLEKQPKEQLIYFYRELDR